MDVQTSQAIDDVRADLGQVETALRSEIRGVEISLRVEISSLRAEIKVDMGQMRSDVMRHFDVVAESLHDDIRILAEGLVALGAKVDALRGPRG